MSTQSEFAELYTHMRKVIIGQERLLDRLIIGLLAGGHLLLESPPGLAKTTAVKTLASGIHASFQRVQFTPDLLPGDLTGGEIFDPKEGEFRFVAGPLFNEIVLADEINRAPPKVQSALLEAMEEHQITVGAESRPLPQLFMVLATQNPVEQAGTYPLPEAQLDRFLMKVSIDYPDNDAELDILRRDRASHFGDDVKDAVSPLHPEQVFVARREVADIHIDPDVERYIVNLVSATRQPPQSLVDWQGAIRLGASPRATLGLARAAAAHAYLNKRDFVTPDDIVELAPDVLGHRVVLDFSARARGLTAGAFVSALLAELPMP